MMESVDFCYIC